MVLRISGLASGIDTDSIIKELMKAHKVPVDKLKQQKQTIEWQRDAYRDMNKKLLDFRNNKLFNFKLESNLASKKTTISGDNQVFSATARAEAPTGTMSVKVMALASSASMTGGDARPAASFDPAKPLSEQNASVRVVPGTDYSFKINGVQIDVDTSADSLNAVISRINQKTNVNAFYDSFTGKISLTSKTTGENAKIEFTEDTNNFATDVLKLPAGASDPVPKGTNAMLELNGVLTQRESNAFTVNNVDFVLKQKSVFTGSTPADELDPSKYVATSVGVSTDADKIVESIKGFIADYNDVLKTMQDEVSEKKYRDFLPLTDEQRSSMKEDEIKLWETKAKSGLLYNDSILKSAIGFMRSASSTLVNTGSKYNSLSSIGIGSISYLENGKLSIKDETKLRDAIEKDPAGVVALFSASGNGDSDRSDVGVAQNLYDNLKTTLENMGKKSGTSIYTDSGLKEDSVMGKQLTDLNKRISDSQARLIDLESGYYKRFSAMEAAISKYNSQSSSLSSYFS
ncbi:flagellar filament capping protein FliD [Paenibacillus silvisoli]|uniref:flagellar filament capping protein FliD n=1 Tax=Paenibacillus silvisoli TaxID=3110539 RepID=UPI0028044548|nr:flagellar filament capping protein FliD [Paenibacillus silvisoli]